MRIVHASDILVGHRTIRWHNVSRKTELKLTKTRDHYSVFSQASAQFHCGSHQACCPQPFGNTLLILLVSESTQNKHFQCCRLFLRGSTGKPKNVLFPKRMAYGPGLIFLKMADFRILTLLFQNQICAFQAKSAAKSIFFARLIYVIVVHRRSFRWFTHDNHAGTLTLTPLTRPYREYVSLRDILSDVPHPGADLTSLYSLRSG